VLGAEAEGAAERVGLGDGDTLAGVERAGVVGALTGGAGAVVADGLTTDRAGPGFAAGAGRTYR
jgi:hypothetical protein